MNISLLVESCLSTLSLFYTKIEVHVHCFFYRAERSLLHISGVTVGTPFSVCITPYCITIMTILSLHIVVPFLCEGNVELRDRSERSLQDPLPLTGTRRRKVRKVRKCRMICVSMPLDRAYSPHFHLAIRSGFFCKIMFTSVFLV